MGVEGECEGEEGAGQGETVAGQAASEDWSGSKTNLPVSTAVG